MCVGIFLFFYINLCTYSTYNHFVLVAFFSLTHALRYIVVGFIFVVNYLLAVHIAFIEHLKFSLYLLSLSYGYRKHYALHFLRF